MSESGPETPKSLKRIRNEHEEYRQGEMGILDLAPQDLVIKRTVHLGKSQRQSNYNKFHILCYEVQNSEGNGDQIISTLGREIVLFQNDTVDVMMGGLR